MPSLAPITERRPLVLVVNDDDATRELLAHVLRKDGYEVATLERGDAVVDHVRRVHPDLVLLDIMLPDVCGFEILGDLRMIDESRTVPVILISAMHVAEADVVRGLLAGADDYVVTPARIHEILARVRVQLRNKRDRDLLRNAQRDKAHLADAALTDPLTGLANRRAADEALAHAFEGASSVMLMVIDVDHFKRVNDEHGHPAGDAVLRELGKTLRRVARDVDLVARFGGEEFVVLIRDAPFARHAGIAERFLAGARDMRMPVGLGIERITVSIGALSWSAARSAVLAPEVLVERADRALYVAKRTGRDRLVVDDEVGEPCR